MYVSMTCNLLASAMIFSKFYANDPLSINEIEMIFPKKKVLFGY
jgi:hypothetical protein